MKKNSKMFKSGLLVLAALGIQFGAQATAYTAIANGNYSSGTTWLGGTAPSSNLTTADNVVVTAGLTIALDVDVTINNALATFTLNGTLLGSHNLDLQNGSLSGTGTLNVHDLTFEAPASSTFTGIITADDIFNSSSALSFTGKTRINDTLGLYNGAVSTVAGDTLTLGANAVIHTINGTYTTGGGAIYPTGNVNLLYTGSGTASTGGEISLPNISNLIVRLSSSSNQLNLSADVIVGGQLNVQSGSLNINGHSLILNGTVTTSASGSLTGNNTSNLTLGGTGSMGTLIFTSGSSLLNNLTVNGSSTASTVLGSDLTVSGVLTLTSGKISLTGGNDLILTGLDTIHGGSAVSYVATSGTGSLTASITGGVLGNSRMMHIGTSANYAPLRITNTSLATTNFSTNAHPGIFANGTSGTDLSTTRSSVNTSWNVEADVTTGVNVSIEAFWNATMEVNGFNRSNVRLSHYINNAWDDSMSVQASTHSGGMASVTRTGITSLSPFAVFSGPATGISDVSANGTFATYPNPAFNTITVTIAESKANDEAKVYDMIGNHVATYALHNTSNTIDISTLTAGVYFLSVNNAHTQKFVKQ